MAARLSEFIDDELDAAQCEAIRSHMAECRRCRDFASSLERTVALCRALPHASVPEPLKREIARLVDRLREHA